MTALVTKCAATKQTLTIRLPAVTAGSLITPGSDGTFAHTGSAFDTVGVAWQYRWGGGLYQEVTVDG